MSVKAETTGKSATHKLETQATYEIGKTKVLVTRIWEDDAQTLDGILVRLMKKEVEKS